MQKNVECRYFSTESLEPRAGWRWYFFKTVTSIVDFVSGSNPVRRLANSVVPKETNQLEFAFLVDRFDFLARKEIAQVDGDLPKFIKIIKERYEISEEAQLDSLRALAEPLFELDQILRQAKELAQMPFSAENEEHEAMLMRVSKHLRKLVALEQPLPSQKASR